MEVSNLCVLESVQSGRSGRKRGEVKWWWYWQLQQVLPLHVKENKCKFWANERRHPLFPRGKKQKKHRWGWGGRGRWASRDPRARTRNREREGAVHTGGGTLASLATRDVAMPPVRCNFSIFILETGIWHDAPSLKARRCCFPACRCRVAEKYMQKKSQSSCYRSLCCDSTSKDVLLRHPDAKCFAEESEQLKSLRKYCSQV